MQLYIETHPLLTKLRVLWGYWCGGQKASFQLLGICHIIIKGTFIFFSNWACTTRPAANILGIPILGCPPCVTVWLAKHHLQVEIWLPNHILAPTVGRSTVVQFRFHKLNLCYPDLTLGPKEWLIDSDHDQQCLGPHTHLHRPINRWTFYRTTSYVFNTCISSFILDIFDCWCEISTFAACLTAFKAKES